jgi:hypothetical protein
MIPSHPHVVFNNGAFPPRHRKTQYQAKRLLQFTTDQGQLYLAPLLVFQLENGHSMDWLKGKS